MINFSDMTNPELDKAVAEKVMGYVDRGIEYYIGERIDITENWHFTTDISQAFDVVNKMIADGWTMYGDLNKYGIGVKFMKGNIELDEVYNNKSIPRAICIAALMANRKRGIDGNHM